ncbi:hypothetical protein Tco_0681243 [Tanacetum coccineum]|uniref:Uncharacterized protein n=1 Tax=Tanacetum coccineum TaxID=301880 RepID=A0ABQ4XMS1_9ASTR
MAKLILNEARAEQYLAEPSIESNEKYELDEELLKELRSNSYSGRVEEDVVGNIDKILKILDWIEVDGMDPFQLRMNTFPLLLSGKARKCDYDKMCVDDEEEVGNNEGIMDDDNGSDVTDHLAKVLEITEWIKIPNVSKDELRLHVFSKSLSRDVEKWWNSEGTVTSWKELSDTFFHKYYPLSHTYKDGKDIYEIIDRDYSPIPIHAHHDISNPEKLCQTEEFTVIRYSVGSCEEYITAGPSKISTIEKTPGSMSCIYHELFNKKDRGWAITRTK